MAQIAAEYRVKNAAGTYDEMMFTTLATQVTEDATHKFVTDTEKTTWNSKASTAVVSTTVNGLMSYNDKIKLNGVATGANAYVHPPDHAPAVITQDANNRFVTDAEKALWNKACNYATIRTTTPVQTFRVLNIISTGKNLIEWKVAIGNKNNTSTVYLEINTVTGAYILGFSCGGAIVTEVALHRINSTTWLVKWNSFAGIGASNTQLAYFTASEITNIGFHMGGNGDTFENVTSVLTMI